MKDILFTLIIPTIRRTRELSRLLESLVSQKKDSFELKQIEIILVDQNKDDRLLRLLDPYRDKIVIDHVRDKKKGVSKAKNEGLGKIRGRYVAFPDDDCFYEKNTLEKVLDFFRETGGRYALFARGKDPDRRIGVLSYPNHERTIFSPKDPSVFFGIQWTQFFTRKMIREIGKFDEDFGIGAPWGSGEETDYAIRCLKRGYPIRFMPDILVFHHRVVPETMEIEKIRGYALGFGALCRKQRMTGHFIWKSVKQAGGFVFFALTFRWKRSRACFELLRFRFKGYWGYGQKSKETPLA